MANICHIIISTVVNSLYNKKLTIQAQQIRNKNSYNCVNIMQGNESKYKIELFLIKPLLLYYSKDGISILLKTILLHLNQIRSSSIDEGLAINLSCSSIKNIVGVA